MTQKLSPEKVAENLKALSEWQQADLAIQKQFEFDSFPLAINFLNRVAKLAEEADHHPDMTIKYRRVTMALSTHSEGGITQKDFDLAHKIDGAAKI